MDSNIDRTAIEVLKALRDEVNSLQTKLAHYEDAKNLTFNLLKEGQISVDIVEQVFDDFLHKSPEELQILRKAGELNKQASINNLFSIDNDVVENYSEQPFLQVLLEDR